MKLELIAPCHFGLEKCLKREIRDLGYEISGTSDGKVSFFADTPGICRANIFIRTAERVLVKAAEFRASDWEELFERTYAVEWEKFIPWGGRVWVAKAASVKSKLFSPRDFQTVIQKAVIMRLKAAYRRDDERMPMDGALFALRVTAYKDIITIGIDTSGESLHKRGYRRNTAKAPISETLASALLMLTPFEAGRILIDPFCGSGTFPIEAAMMAADIAPGMERNFAAADWSHLIERKSWHAAYDEARVRKSEGLKRLGTDTDIAGFDTDAAMIAAAGENAVRAGIPQLIHFGRRDVRDLNHPGRNGIIVTNPPYGERLSPDRTSGRGEAGDETSSDHELFVLYRTLGERVRALDDFSLYMISAYKDAEKAVGIKAARNRKVYNGMIKAYFYSFPRLTSGLN